MADDPFKYVLDKIASLDGESSRLKRWINDGDIIAGREPRFANVGDGSVFAVEGVVKPKGRQFSPGQFFNKPFAGAVKLIMIGSYEANGNQPAPVSVDDIHESLLQGSFSFGTSGADSQKNSIRISLGKNSTTFVKLPGSDLFGLAEWYGKKPKRVRLQVLAGNADADDEDAENEGDDGGGTAASNDGYFTGEAQPETETKTAEPVKPNFRRL